MGTRRGFARCSPSAERPPERHDRAVPRLFIPQAPAPDADLTERGDLLSLNSDGIG
jgi:hypothetical protein